MKYDKEYNKERSEVVMILFNNLFIKDLDWFCLFDMDRELVY